MTISKKLLISGALILGMQGGIQANSTPDLPQQDHTKTQEITTAKTLEALALIFALTMVIAMAEH
jgi:hypothetical protein